MEIDAKKPEFNNDELSIDVKTGLEGVVIPVKEEDIKPDTHVVIPEYDVTISNTEVVFTILFNFSLLLLL